LSIFDLNFKNDFAHLSFSLTVTKYDWGVESKTDSVREQTKETNNARNK